MIRFLIGIAMFTIALASCIFFLSFGDDSNVRTDGTSNVEVMRRNGHPIPDLRDWWIDQPSPSDLIDSLVDPLKSTGGLCVGRLWLPRDDEWEGVDKLLVSMIEKRPTGPHQLAMCSHFHNSHGDHDRARELMTEAKTWFWDQDRDRRVYCSFRTRRLLADLLALDWIEWSNHEEFGRAYKIVKSSILTEVEASTSRGKHFRKTGYWNATNTVESAYYLEQLLAYCVCGITDDAESNRWARLRIAQIDSLDNDKPLYSTFRFCNVLSLLSRRGGGREYGQQEGGPGVGGYEQCFLASGVIQIEALDTATNRKWNLRERNLYFKTRQLGLITEIDRTVAKTKNSPAADSCLSILSRFFREEPEIGGRYQWCLGQSPTLTSFQEFQALAGPAPSPEPPSREPLIERIGSRWHYRDDPRSPDKCFRMWIVNRDLENFRYGPDERCMSFCIGNVGLVDGHANRTAVIGSLANGIHISGMTTQGEPVVADTNFWASFASHHPYWSPDRAVDDSSVLNNPAFSVGDDGPTKNQGDWTWDCDYSRMMTRVLDSPIFGKVSHARTSYQILPQERKIEIVDTIRADQGIYVGWHFSPTHMVELEKRGFRFGDGTDEIVVHIEGLDGTQLQVKRRKEWKHDGYTLPLDWHETKGGPKRVAENIGYTPIEYRSEYKVRVVIQANPND
ncbi:hypothetical protein NZK35_08885 [Stieleria sp. ICT_E10.1]|uniref:hypothetical protein n=1 Tax=Stieleria sedimenti TaxID=2976331 RepID=UPI00217FFC25|nr:hypothetical protein [Stieleria sedimenti]MCS7466756.1 hypothetical protein [Stieleria sedimenti]